MCTCVWRRREHKGVPVDGSPSVTLTATDTFLHHLLSLRLTSVDPTACGHYFALVAVLVQLRAAGSPGDDSGREKTPDPGTPVLGDAVDSIELSRSPSREHSFLLQAGRPGSAPGGTVPIQGQRKSAGTAADVHRVAAGDAPWKAPSSQPLVRLPQFCARVFPRQPLSVGFSCFRCEGPVPTLPIHQTT